MGENQQNKTESKLTATEDKLWLPPLSTEAQRRLKRFHKKPFAERMIAGKASWDWIQLTLQIVGALAVVLTLISLMVNVQQFKEQQSSENDRTIQQQRSEQARLTDQQQQTTLETYLDRMSDLLFTQHLDKSKPGDEVQQLARARTLAALQVLNPARKRILLQFLYESHLIGYYDLTHNSIHSPVIDLFSANLFGTDLSGANLFGAYLSGADLFRADLSGANLFGADLSLADLRDAHLRDAYLRGADLGGADLGGADLSRAHLNGTRNLTQQQLDQVFTCKGATLPKGLICHRNQ